MDKLHFENVKFEISTRHDLNMFIFNNSYNITDLNQDSYKISGTSSRLSKNYSFHHCTLLLNVNLNNMNLLKSKLALDGVIINNKSTPSVRSKCKNIIEFNNKLNIENLINQISNEYWLFNHKDWSINYLFNYINPNEYVFSENIEFNKFYNELTSWHYIYANTPKFQIKLNLDELVAGSSIIFSIETGLITKIETHNIDFKYLDQFQTHSYLFYNLELKLEKILNMFDNNKFLLNMKLFQLIYTFFNKHFI